MSDDGTQWAGNAMMIGLPDRAAVEAMLAEDPCVRAGLYDSIEIHNGRFGGRHLARDPGSCRADVTSQDA